MQPTDLKEHPEGGKYKEVFRSLHKVEAKYLGTRSALTHIYFKLENGEVSTFHKVSSEEVWNLYQGDGIRLYQWDGESDDIKTIELSDAANQFYHVVPAHYWQAAELIGESALVGCSVAPGFEFQDFILLRDCMELAEKFKKDQPSLNKLV